MVGGCAGRLDREKGVTPLCQNQIFHRRHLCPGGSCDTVYQKLAGPSPNGFLDTWCAVQKQWGWLCRLLRGKQTQLHHLEDDIKSCLLPSQHALLALLLASLASPQNLLEMQILWQAAREAGTGLAIQSTADCHSLSSGSTNNPT